MILDRIAGAARRRVEEKKRIKPLDLVMKEALACAESLKGRGCGKGDSNSPGDFEQARRPARVFLQQIFKLCRELRVIFVMFICCFQLCHGAHQCFRYELAAVDSESSI